MKYRLEIGNQTHKVEVVNDTQGKISAILIDDQKFPISEIIALKDVKLTQKDEKITLEHANELIDLNFYEITDDQIEEVAEKNNINQMKEFFKEGKLFSPMPGKIVDMRCSEGSIIEKGKVVLSLEAMKMENEIHTPFTIEVKKLLVKVSDSVIERQLLIEYEIKDDN